ncbi:MAG: PDZ domain-containing protein [Bryobacteraceae bacterium]|jgi:serine protease Do
MSWSNWLGYQVRASCALLVGLLACLPLAAFQSPAHPGSQSSGPMYMAFAGEGSGGSYLGINIAEVDAERAKALKLPSEEGVEVTRVEPDSPADKAGLKVGDVVLEYNGDRVEGMEQFGRMVHETPAGRKAAMKISRVGAVQTLTAVIGTRKAGPGGFMVVPHFEMPEMRMPDIAEGFPGWRSGMLGIETESLNGQLADFFGVKQGVLIRSVLSGSPAEKAGIKAGDVLTRVDDQDVITPGQVSGAVQAARTKHTVSLKLVRNKHEMTVTATLDDDHSAWPAFPDTQFIQAFPK